MLWSYTCHLLSPDVSCSLGSQTTLNPFTCQGFAWVEYDKMSSLGFELIHMLSILYDRVICLVKAMQLTCQFEAKLGLEEFE